MNKRVSEYNLVLRARFRFKYLPHWYHNIYSNLKHNFNGVFNAKYNKIDKHTFDVIFRQYKWRKDERTSIKMQ